MSDEEFEALLDDVVTLFEKAGLQADYTASLRNREATIYITSSVWED